jgi:hypothetical protein
MLRKKMDSGMCEFISRTTFKHAVNNWRSANSDADCAAPQQQALEYGYPSTLSLTIEHIIHNMRHIKKSIGNGL